MRGSIHQKRRLIYSVKALPHFLFSTQMGDDKRRSQLFEQRPSILQLSRPKKTSIPLALIQCRYCMTKWASEQLKDDEYPVFLKEKNPAPWRSLRKVIWPLPPSFSRPWPFLPCLPFRFIAPSVDLPVDSRVAQSILLPNRRDASSILTRVKGGGGSEDACFIVVISKE